MTGTNPPPDDPAAFAVAFESAFRSAYLRFHRRDGKRSGLTGASRAVLLHLAHTGPLTVGEAARHLDRAQSVVSDIVTQLEGKGLLAREPDERDRRRTLVWLTDAGFDALDADQRVLAPDLLARAAAVLPPERRRALLDDLHALLAADDATGPGATDARGEHPTDQHGGVPTTTVTTTPARQSAGATTEGDPR